ncbi:MAG: sulfatase-like hydrolase/transferase [Myxococcota bacterium]
MAVPVFVSTLLLLGLTAIDPFGAPSTALRFEPIVALIVLVASVQRGWIWCALFGATLLVFRVFALAEQSCRHYLHRPLELVNDIQLLPDLKLLLQDTGGHRTVSALAISLFGCWLLCLGALRIVSRRPRAVLLAIGFSLGLSASVGGFAPLSTRLVDELDGWRDPSQIENRIDIEFFEAERQVESISPDSWRRRDVHLILVESYGRIVFDHPELSEFRSTVLPSFEDTLNDVGLVVASGWYRSPTFGGRSWLAHASIDSGAQITGTMRYERLLSSQLTPIAERFARAGYATTTVAPGITMPWPEGDYFGYHRKLYFDDIGYPGPRFGWATVPDQWLFEHVTPLIERDHQPSFVQWHLVSTHAPFATHAPLVPRAQLSKTDPYRNVEPVRFSIQWPYLDDAHRGYAWAMTYEFDVLAEVLPRLLAEGGIAVVIGDHQPNGALTQKDAPWHVPCHVVVGEPDDLKLWRGFREGMFPAPNASAPPLAQLHRDLLKSETALKPEPQRGLDDLLGP